MRQSVGSAAMESIQLWMLPTSGFGQVGMERMHGTARQVRNADLETAVPAVSRFA